MLISLKKTQIDFMSVGNLKHALFPAFTGICQFHENGTEVIFFHINAKVLRDITRFQLEKKKNMYMLCVRIE